MKILTIGPVDSLHTVRPVRSLLRKSHEVCLIGYQGNNPFARQNYKRYTWFRDPGDAPFPRSEEGIKKTTQLLSTVFKTFDPDIVHIHWLSWHLLPCKNIAPHTPKVVSIWGTDINIALESCGNNEYVWGHTLETLNAKNLYLADHIIVDDSTMIAKCKFAAPNTPTTLLPLGADKIFFNPIMTNVEKIRKKLSANDAHIFTSMRVVRDNYRSDDILRAFASVARERNAILVFKNFLYHPKPWQELITLAHDLGVERQVRFIDNLTPEELRDLYAASTALINFPVRDGFPVSFAESAAVGADVITCDNPAYDVPLVHECFEVLPVDNVQSLATAMERRLEVPVSHFSRNDKAIEMARNYHSHAVYVEGLEKIYNELTGGNR